MSAPVVPRLPTVPVTFDGVDELDAAAREAALLEDLGRLEGCAVAFSGGVDSTYLLWAAVRALGQRTAAVTAFSPSYPQALRAECARLARAIGARHEVIETRELEDERYRNNDRDRCYWCKSELYGRLEAIVAAHPGLVVVDGSNRDDLGDVRPGRRAATERGVRSPLIAAGLTKAAIRWLSRRAGLPTWERPASPCLSSRVPYGQPVSIAKLEAIDRAEEVLHGLGLRELRVRHLGDEARIELAGGELAAALEPDRRAAIEAAVCAAGGFVAARLDEAPFRSGRLNDEAPA